jgi:hypothetical protein
MRQVRPDAIALIALQSKDMPTQYGGTKPRPYFKILGWKTRGDIGPQNLLAGPEAPEQKFVEPTNKEIYRDEIPEQDWEPPWAPPGAPVQHAAPQEDKVQRPTTKRGGRGK